MEVYNTSYEKGLFWEEEQDNSPEIPDRGTLEKLRLGLIFVLFVMGVVLSIALIMQQAIELSTKNAVFVVERIQCILLINLGVAQLMISFWLVLTTGLVTLIEQWYAGDIMCKLVKFLIHLSDCAFAYSVMALLIAQVTHGLSKRVTGAPVMYLRFILPVWIISAVISIPQAFVVEVIEHPFLTSCVMIIDSRLLYISYTVADYSLIHILPLLVSLGFLLTAIVQIIKERCRRTQRNLDTEQRTVEMGPIKRDHTDTAGEDSQSDSRKHSLIPLIGTFVYFSCWTPSVVMSLLAFNSSYTNQTFFTLYTWLNMLEYAASPCIALVAIICTKFKI